MIKIRYPNKYTLIIYIGWTKLLPWATNPFSSAWKRQSYLIILRSLNLYVDLSVQNALHAITTFH